MQESENNMEMMDELAQLKATEEAAEQTQLTQAEMLKRLSPKEIKQVHRASRRYARSQQRLTSQARFTRKQTTKAQRAARRKMQANSRKINRGSNQGKRATG